MPTIIENKIEITRPIFMEWKKARRAASYKKTMRTIIIVIAVLVAAAVGWLYTQGMPPVMLVVETLLMAGTSLWVILVLPRSKNKGQYKGLCQAAGGTPKRTVKFYADHFSVVTESGNVRDFSYGSIEKLKEAEHFYVLVNGSDIDVLINKNGFIKGNMEQVKELLPENCEII